MKNNLKYYFKKIMKIPLRLKKLYLFRQLKFQLLFYTKKIITKLVGTQFFFFFQVE